MERFFILPIVVSLVFTFSSCSTVKKPTDAVLRARSEGLKLLDGQDLDREEAAPSANRPWWIQEQPVIEDYYVGIGHSPDTGKIEDDRKRAKLDALNELAQSISVHIISEIEDHRKERYGTYYDEMEISIKTTVDLEVQDAELVSSYYSKEDGYWVYYRLSKREWERIKEVRMELLEDRVRSLVDSSIEDISLTVSERLGLLTRAIQIVIDSGFAGIAKATLFEKHGFLLDTLITKREALLQSLSVEVVPSEAKISSRGIAKLKVIVASEEGTAGVMPVIFIREGTVIDRIVTDSNGIYDGEVSLSNLPYGYSTVSARVDIRERKKSTHSPAMAEVAVYKRPLNAVIRALTSDEIMPESIYPAALSIFSFLDTSMIRFASAKEDSVPVLDKSDPNVNMLGPDIVIEFSIFFREAPKSDYDIFITYMTAWISILKEGQAIFSHKTPEYKDMGLTVNQARERVFKRVIAVLKEDQDFQKKVQSLLKDWYSW